MTNYIPSKIQKLIINNKKDKSLWLLSKLIDDLDYGLFSTTEQEYIRFINSYRIRLLIEWNMYRDALAYICLECELNPEEAKSYAYKDYLIGLINSKSSNTFSNKQETEKSSWSGVAGMNELKTIFERDVIMMLRKPELYERYKISLPNGILLYGPPGCGKTFIARKLAEEIEFNFMEISPADLGSTYVHGTQLEIKRAFTEAIENSPTLLFIDEIEALVPSRNNANVSFHYKSEVNEFLTQLDQCGKKGVLVVGATNRISDIDTSILRPGRFDKKIFVGPPDLEARIEAFKIHVQGRPHENIQWLFLSEMAENYTFAEIEHVVNEAARLAIELRSPINTNILGKVISNNKPALNEKVIKGYF